MFQKRCLVHQRFDRLVFREHDGEQRIKCLPVQGQYENALVLTRYEHRPRTLVRRQRHQAFHQRRASGVDIGDVVDAVGPAVGMSSVTSESDHSDTVAVKDAGDWIPCKLSRPTTTEVLGPVRLRSTGFSQRSRTAG